MAAIWNYLKRVLPPPVNSFMREINTINRKLDDLGNAILEQEGIYDQTIAQSSTELAVMITDLTHLIKALQQEVRSLKTDIEAVKLFQMEFQENVNDWFAKQAEFMGTLDSTVSDMKGQMERDVTAIKKRCSALELRERKLLRDKRFLEQMLLGKVPNFSEIALELTNHCGYNCIICPREQMSRERGIMSNESIGIVAKRLQDQVKKEFILWTDGMGEVMILDDFFDKIRLIKTHMPNALPYVVTTLGYKKEESYWDELLQVGIKRIMISIYGYDDKTYQLLHGVDRHGLVLSNLERLFEKERLLGNPVEIMVSVENFGKEFFAGFEHFDYEKHSQLREQFVSTLKKKYPEVMIFKRTIHNRGQAFHFAAPKVGIKKCFIDDYPTRQNKLYITWDLKVLPCPMIFNNEIVFGDLKEQSLEEIYNGEAYRTFLNALQSGDLHNYQSCQNCNM